MFDQTDQAMMELALRQARLALEEGEIPVGAVIARGDTVIAEARNTRERAGDPTGHAEVNAIRLAAQKLGGWRLNGCTLYVTLEPCAMCAGAIVMSRLSRVVYGARDPAAGCCGSVYRLSEDPALGVYVPADGGLMAEECQALLKGAMDSLRDRRA